MSFILLVNVKFNCKKYNINHIFVTANDIPGVSSCFYLGDTDVNCKKHPMSIGRLPKECTSFFYDGLKVSALGDKIDFSQYFDDDGKQIMLKKKK